MAEHTTTVHIQEREVTEQEQAEQKQKLENLNNEISIQGTRDKKISEFIESAKKYIDNMTSKNVSDLAKKIEMKEVFLLEGVKNEEN